MRVWLIAPQLGLIVMAMRDQIISSEHLRRNGQLTEMGEIEECGRLELVGRLDGILTKNYQKRCTASSLVVWSKTCED